MAGTAALGLALAACGSDATRHNNAAGAESSDTASSESSSGRDRHFTNDKCCEQPDQRRRASRVGGILPLTGNLAFLGPPEIAGVGLAVSDINAAGGVDGAKACHDIQDSGDSTDMSVSTAIGRHRSSRASRRSSSAPRRLSVSLNVVDTFADEQDRRGLPREHRGRPERLLAVLLPHRSAGRRSRATRSAR